MAIPPKTNLTAAVRDLAPEDSHARSHNTSPTTTQAAHLLQALSTTPSTTTFSPDPETTKTMNWLAEHDPREHDHTTNEIQTTATTAMNVYNTTLSRARARHPSLPLHNINNDTFTIADVQDALVITSLHRGREITLAELMSAVESLNQNNDMDVGFTSLGLLQAIEMLWGVDFVRLVAGRDAVLSPSVDRTVENMEDEEAVSLSSSPGTVEEGEDLEESEDENKEAVAVAEEDEDGRVKDKAGLDERPRRVSPRQKNDDVLKYSARYHPMDEVVRPGRVSTLKGLNGNGKGKSG